MKRVYNVPLRKEFQKVPPYKRAKKAVRALKEFLVKHTKSENIKLGPFLNEKIWERGIKRPPHHVKINVEKTDTEVVAELFGKPMPEKPQEEKKETLKEKVFGKKDKKEKKKSEDKASKETQKPEVKSDKKTEISKVKKPEVKQSEEKPKVAEVGKEKPEVKPEIKQSEEKSEKVKEE